MTGQDRKPGAQAGARHRRDRYIVAATLVAVLLMMSTAALVRSQLLDRAYDERLDLVSAMGNTPEGDGPPSTFRVEGAVARCPAVNVGGDPVVINNVSDVASASRPCESTATERRVLATATIVALAAGCLVVVLLAFRRLRQAARRVPSERAL